MSLLRRRAKVAPGVLPTHPGYTAMAEGIEYVVRTVTYTRDGELTIDLLRRDVWERRYRVHGPEPVAQ